MPIEGLPESGRTRVYRKIVDRLRTDPALKSLDVEWIPWDGSTKATRPTATSRPTIVLFPTLGPMKRVSPDAQSGNLVIAVEIHMPGGFDACDCMDLWEAIEQAIYPFNERERQKVFQRSLVNARPDGCDAVTGEIEFLQPAVPGEPRGQTVAEFVGYGLISVLVQRSLNH